MSRVVDTDDVEYIHGKQESKRTVWYEWDKSRLSVLCMTCYGKDKNCKECKGKSARMGA
jgi:hypothetical protein